MYCGQKYQMRSCEKTFVCLRSIYIVDIKLVNCISMTETSLKTLYYYVPYNMLQFQKA